MNCENCPYVNTDTCKVVYFNGKPVCTNGFCGKGFKSTAAFDQLISDTEASK